MAQLSDKGQRVLQDLEAAEKAGKLTEKGKNKLNDLRSVSQIQTQPLTGTQDIQAQARQPQVLSTEPQPTLKERAIEAAPLVGAMALPMVAPAGTGVAALAGLGGLGAGFGEASRQMLSGESLRTTPGEAAKKIGKEGLIGAAGELTFGLGAKGVAKSYKYLRKGLGTTIDFITGAPSGAGEELLKAKGKVEPVTAQAVDDVIGKVVQGVDDLRSSAQNKYKVALEKELAETGRKGLIPPQELREVTSNLSGFLKLNSPGEFAKGSKAVKGKIADLAQEVNRVVESLESGKGQLIPEVRNVNVENILTLRRRLDALIREAKGEALDTSAFTQAREMVDALVWKHHPNIKIADRTFREMTDTLDDVQDTLGIDVSLKPGERVPQAIREKVETKVANVFRGRETFRDSLVKLDDKLATLDNFLEDATKFGVAKAFSANASGLARIQILGALIAGGVGAVAGGGGTEGATKGALSGLGILAATSPRAVSGLVRGGFKALPLARVGSRLASQLGARVPSMLMEKGFVEE